MDMKVVGWWGRRVYRFSVGYMPCSFCLCVRALAGAGDRPRGDGVLLGGGWEALCATLDCGRAGAVLRGICDIVRLEGRATPLALGDRGIPEPDGVGKRPRDKECRAAPRQQGCAHDGDSLLSGAHRAL
jgi:hypothetical protein